MICRPGTTFADGIPRQSLTIKLEIFVVWVRTVSHRKECMYMLANTSDTVSTYLLMSANVQDDILLKCPTETGCPEQLSPCLDIFKTWLDIVLGNLL